MKTISRAVVATVLAAALGACTDVTFEGGGPLTFELTADRTTARTGQDVTFSFTAKGAALDGVIVAFGDGKADTMQTANATTASGRFVHAYATVGTFTAVGSVWDAQQGPATDQVVIQITGS